ncbi:MAG: hypothetical protein ACTSPD_09350 [Promethearchaeota archaeon]
MSNSKVNTKISTSQGQKKIINIQCPICKSKKNLEIPIYKIKQTSQLTTISIPKGTICKHHFQLFLDKHFKVRGYQKVDFELKAEKKYNNISEIEKFNSFREQSDDKLFNNLSLEGNFVEYLQPMHLNQNQEINEASDIIEKELNFTSKEEMTLEKIYNEFWEFIDDDNEEFLDLILKDKRRNKRTK